MSSPCVRTNNDEVIAELGDHNHMVVRGNATMETVQQAMKQRVYDTDETTKKLCIVR